MKQRHAGLVETRGEHGAPRWLTPSAASGPRSRGPRGFRAPVGNCGGSFARRRNLGSFPGRSRVAHGTRERPREEPIGRPWPVRAAAAGQVQGRCQAGSLGEKKKPDGGDMRLSGRSERAARLAQSRGTCHRAQGISPPGTEKRDVRRPLPLADAAPRRHEPRFRLFKMKGKWRPPLMAAWSVKERLDAPVPQR